MSERVKRWLQRVRRGRGAADAPDTPDERQRGQSLIIIVFAFIGLLALVGLGIDLGMVYVERVQIGRAVDAAALAAVAELPLEEAAYRRALSYLQENGYDYLAGDVQVITNTYESGVYSTTVDAGAWTTIWIDTKYSREPATQVNTANRIRIRLRQQVPMTFLQFIGFRHFPVEAIAEAENINYIDTVIVYDRSGSMEFNTVCYGCWEMPRTIDDTPDDPSECQSSDTDCCLASKYPDGCVWPLPWSLTYQGENPPVQPDHCLTSNLYYTDTGKYYIVIEAEEYSYMYPESYIGLDYHQTFWAIQRNDQRWNWPNWSNVGARGRDTRGAYLQHRLSFGQFAEESPGVPCPDVTGPKDCGGKRCCNQDEAPNSVAPWVEYDFNVPADGTYYFWLRGQGGYYDDQRYIFWDVDGDVPKQKGGFPGGPMYSYDGANSSWSWIRLGSSVLNKGITHKLILWGGGSGFSADRIIITTNNTTAESELKYKDVLQANNGRTRNACHPCDPRFAGRYGGHKWINSNPEERYYRPDCPVEGVDLRADPLYRGERPIEDALNAAEHFITLLDPRFDQVGYVVYQGSAEIRSELECLRRRGVENLNPPCDLSACDTSLSSAGCKACGCTSTIITKTVLYQLQHTFADDGTNIAGGIKSGLDVLSAVGPCSPGTSSSKKCGRYGAAHIMILMTDGRANASPETACYSNENAKLYPPDDDTGDSYDRAADCVVYYANRARNSGVVIYTIALGSAADYKLMTYVAELTGGDFFPIEQPEQLVDAFDEIYKRAFLRLTH